MDENFGYRLSRLPATTQPTRTGRVALLFRETARLNTMRLKRFSFLFSTLYRSRVNIFQPQTSKAEIYLGVLPCDKYLLQGVIDESIRSILTLS